VATQGATSANGIDESDVYLPYISAHDDEVVLLTREFVGIHRYCKKTSALYSNLIKSKPSLLAQPANRLV
jgi:hypothetical protein